MPQAWRVIVGGTVLLLLGAFLVAEFTLFRPSDLSSPAEMEVLADQVSKRHAETEDAMRQGQPSTLSPLTPSLVQPTAPSSSRTSFDSYLAPPGLWDRVPQFVKAWRSGGIDWHELFRDWKALKLRSKDAERKGDPGRRGFLARESIRYKQLDVLLHPQRPEREWGVFHGPLAAYAACPMLRDKCLIHSPDACARDELCDYDTKQQLCVSFDSKSKVGAYRPEVSAYVGRLGTSGDPGEPCNSGAKRVVNGRFEAVSNFTQCKRFVHAAVTSPQRVPDDAKMYWHWWDYFRSTLLRYRARPNNDKPYRHVLFAEGSGPIDDFSPYLSAVSPTCWRYVSEVPASACFCRAGDTHGGFTGQQGAVKALQEAAGVQAPDASLDQNGTAPRVCLLSRKRKRFLLNEPDLLEAARQLVAPFGGTVVTLSPEIMTLHEQLHEIRRCTVLAGIHGSGLTNVLFLERPGACLLQLCPILVGEIDAGDFGRIAMGMGLKYVEWRATNRSLSTFHWEYAPKAVQKGNAVEREAFVAERMKHRGQTVTGSPEFRTFWINQQLVIPVEEWKNSLKSCGSRAVGGSATKRKTTGER